MKPRRIWFSSPWLTVGLLAIFLGIAFYLRVAPPYSQVFSGNWIKYTTTDAYYFVRQIDNLVFNFPHFLAFDPYQLYPTGTVLNGQNFFVLFASSIVWLAGLGHPSQHTVDVVSTYLPAVLGALAVVPVYFIGKALFNRWMGILSAALIAIIPGEFLGRTILGNTDRDAFEVILSALTMLFLILALKSAREKQFTFKGLNFRNIALYSRPLVYSLILGIILGIFVLTWRGAFLFILIILVYFVLQSLIDHFKRRSPEYLGLVSIAALLVAFIIFLIGSRVHLVMAALIVSLLGLVIFTVLERLLAAKKANPVFYPLSMLVIGLLGLGIFYAASPSLFHSLLDQFGVFNSSGVNATISQMQPILSPAGAFTLTVVWGNFTTGIFLIFISLGILVYFMIKRDEPGILLFVVWSVIMLVATLLTRRIALLFALNVALLVGYLGWQILRFFINKTSTPKSLPIVETHAIKKKKKGRENEPQRVKRGFFVRNRIAVISITAIAVFFLIFFPDFGPAVNAANEAAGFTPSDDWYQSLTWLKNNTPEPLGNPAAYDSYYSQPVPYPASAYGIAAWWDYGYLIMRIGHRLPVSDPGGGAREQVAKLFTAQDEATANAIMDQLGTKYVVIDSASISSKFRGVTTYAGLDVTQFGELFYNVSGTQLTSSVFYYYPKYFQSLAVRLFQFGGEKVIPTTLIVVSYQDKTTQDGTHFKGIVSTNTFTTYDQATAYIAKQTTGNYTIVSNSSSQSPVPLDSLAHYKEVYPTGPATSTVKIFEYTK